MDIKIKNKEKHSEINQKRSTNIVQKDSKDKKIFLSNDFYKFIDSEGTNNNYILGYN